MVFSLLLAVVFGINWLIAVRTIHAQKIADLHKVLHHILVESKDEYIPGPLTPQSDLGFLKRVPHNLLILKESDASDVRFVVGGEAYVPAAGESAESVALENASVLSVVSSHVRVEQAVGRYAQTLLERYVLMLLVILAVGFVLLERYMRPLGILATRAREWKCGDSFALETNAPGQEIEELSQAFSALVHRLEGFRVREKALFKEMAHELKTPIAIMRARLDVFESSDHLSKARIVEELGNDIERLTSELKNVLFFESFDFDEASSFGIDAVLDEVLAKTRILAQRRGLEIERTGRGFGLNVPRRLFVKLLTALVENALTYAREGSTVVLHLDPQGRRISLSNRKGGEKYLFSSRIGQKMLDRISSELGLGYAIDEDDEGYRIDLFALRGPADADPTQKANQ